MKNVIVVSFPRSGTHFLANTIAANFNYYVSYPLNKLPLSDSKDDVTEFIKEQISTRKIYKTHMQSYSFDKCWPDFLKKFHVFYIIRDARDALVSLYRFHKNRHHIKEDKSISDFIREVPPIDIWAYKVAIKKPPTVLICGIIILIHG